MESTGVYWWPVYHALAQAGLKVFVCSCWQRQRAEAIIWTLTHQPALERTVAGFRPGS